MNINKKINTIKVADLFKVNIHGWFFFSFTGSIFILYGVTGYTWKDREVSLKIRDVIINKLKLRYFFNYNL